ncbi:hypothetical protein DPMN_127731 [Dreissena polymorpha]|uniref:Uncharacterized protein n=1 Tax=Dreissena polymorpha TaxID=45954 RepID=A0A9D4GZI2_DREPO|nr:hypothetical protein DPMN_127731 [Dreissena polymorpha]
MQMPDGFCTVAHCLVVCCRCPGLEDCLAPPETVWESPAGANTVWATSLTV